MFSELKNSKQQSINTFNDDKLNRGNFVNYVSNIIKNTSTNKKAFTLIELLAVIVILAIIALIAVPVIMNIINKANKSAFKDTAYGVIQAGELYFA